MGHFVFDFFDFCGGLVGPEGVAKCAEINALDSQTRKDSGTEIPQQFRKLSNQLQVDLSDLLGRPPDSESKEAPTGGTVGASDHNKTFTEFRYHSGQNLQVALDLAGAGFAVFPCRPGQEGDHKAKTPRVKERPAAATRDSEMIRAWWRKWPDSMPGLPTGSRNSLAVLDLDRKHGKDGVAALQTLGFDPDKLSPLTVETPSNGLHLYFAWPEGLGNAGDRAKLGIDVRGQGGYVIAPGAVGHFGAYVARSGATLGQILPEWPSALLQPRAAALYVDLSDLFGSDDADEITVADLKALREPDWPLIRSALRSITDASDRETWRRIGSALHHESGGSDDGFKWWCKWSQRCPEKYNERDQQTSWKSFKRSSGTVITIATLFKIAVESGWVRPLDRLPVVPEDSHAPMMHAFKPIINLHNAILYLGQNLESVLPGLRHNMMTGRDEWRDGPLTDAALTLARPALERLGLKTIGKELVADAALSVAKYRQFHPVRDALNALRHDGTPRLDSWLARHAGAEDSPFVRAVGRKFLLQMVARIMQPGCKADHTLVLSGPQGQNKSTACRILAGADYFSDTLPSIAGDRTDAIRHLQGKWLIELAELAPSRKSEAEDLKAFLSGAVDRVRLPYARFDESFPRQCVFVGTTNEDQFLRDTTGGRRFWPVTVGQIIDLEALARERDQLFAEAVAAYRAGEPWWLDRDFEAEHARPAQEAAFVADGWSDVVANWLDMPRDPFDDTSPLRDQVTVSDVLSMALGIGTAQQTMATQKRAGDVLRGLGWVKVKSHGRILWRPVAQ